MGIGVIFLYLFAVVSLNHATMTLTIVDGNYQASTNFIGFTAGSNGYIMLSVFVVFIIGSIIILVYYMRRKITELIRRGDAYPEDTFPKSEENK